MLSGVMGTRFMRTGKFMPAGLVAGLRSDFEEIKILDYIIIVLYELNYFSFISVLHKLFACLTS